MSAPKGTVHQSTLQGLRGDYLAAWHHAWPHGDDYLAELWHEAKDGRVNERGNHRVPWPVLRQFCLTLMRECDAFEPTEAGR